MDNNISIIAKEGREMIAQNLTIRENYLLANDIQISDYLGWLINNGILPAPLEQLTPKAERTYTKDEIIDLLKWVHQEVSRINQDTAKWVLPDNTRLNSEVLFAHYFKKAAIGK